MGRWNTNYASKSYTPFIKMCFTFAFLAYFIKRANSESVTQLFRTQDKVDKIFYLPSLDIQTHEQKSFADSQLQDNSTLLIEEISRYLQFGEDEIVMSHSTDINLVIGLAGHGKSTFTQLVFNGANRLQATKDKEGSFFITDEAGFINNSLMTSYIPLPYLVVDKETDVAFYDCTGFLGNRNATMEIANAFFMKKVADIAKRIKIIIVVSYSTMQYSAIHNFFDLLEQITFFVKDFKKFRNGVVLITTKMNKGFNDKRTHTHYKEFLENILDDIEGSWAPRANLESAKDIIGILLTTYSSDFLTKVGIFRTPTVKGYLDEMPAFVNLKESFNDLILNKTDYIPCSENDFGFSLNEKASALIKDESIVIDANIENLLRHIGNTILTRFFYSLEKLRNGVFEGLLEFQSNLTGLMNARYPLSENQEGLEVKDYITEIMGTLSNFVANSEVHVFTKLSKYGEQLVFLQKADFKNYVKIRPHMWVAPLVRLPSGIINHIQGDVSSNIYRLIFDELKIFSSEAKTEIFLQISTDDVHLAAKQYKTFKSQLNEISTNVKTYYNSSDKGLSDFLKFTLKEMQELDIPFLKNTPQSFQLHINLSQALDTFPSLNWKLEQAWDTPVSSINEAILEAWVNFQHSLQSNILESIVAIGNQIKQVIVQGFDDAVNGKFENLQSLQFNLNGLSQTNYPLSENTTDLDAAKYVEEIVSNINKFEFDSELKLSDISENLTELTRLAELLDDLIQTDSEHSINITPKLWVESLVAINSSVLTHIEGALAISLFDVIYNEFAAFNIEFQNELLNQLPKNDLNMRGDKLKVQMQKLQQIQSNMALQIEISSLRLSEFLSYMVNQYDALNVVMPPEKLQIMIQKINVAKLFDSFGEINWKKEKEWTQPFNGVYSASLNSWNYLLVDIESNIVSITTHIGTTAVFQLTKIFDDVLNSSYGNIPYLNYNLEAFSKTSYPLSMHIPNLLLNATEYMQEIIQNLEKFNLTISRDEVTQLESLASLLETLHNSPVENSTELNPIEWATSLADINESVLTYVETYISTEILSHTFSSFDDYIKDLNGEMYKILARDEIAARGRRMKTFKSQWGSIKVNMETKLNETNVNLHEFLESMKIEFDVLQVSPSNAAKNSLLLHIQISSVLSTFDRILWQNKYNWQNVFYIRYHEVFAQWLSILNSIEPRIVHITVSIANHVLVSFQNQMVDVKNGRYTNLNPLKQSVDQLKSTAYPVSLNSAGLKASVYINEIVQNIRKFGNLVNSTVMAELTELGALIDSVHQSEDASLLIIHPRTWVVDLANIFSRLTAYVQANVSSSLFLTTFTHLSNFVEDAYVSLLSQARAIDIQDQVQLLAPLAQKFATVNANINRQYQNVNPILFRFFSLALTELKTLNVPISNSHLQNMQISADIGNLLDSFDTIKWKPAQNWVKPINDANDKVIREMTWVRFLFQLFQDLIQSNIQVNKQYSLQAWWKSYSQVTNNNFDNFWTRFSPVSALQNAPKDVIKSAISISAAHLASLNNLLALTLSEGTCQKTYTHSTLYKANFLQLSSAISCYEQHKTKYFVILTLHSFFVDINIIPSYISAAENIYIVSPNWYIIGGQKSFDLRGHAGVSGTSVGSSGTSSGNGRNVIGVYGSINGGIDYATDGGSGGNGREGTTGSSGSKGASQVDFRADYDPHCSAWSGGDIRVKLYPNDCNGSGGTCHAPDNGRWVSMFGKAGTSGGSGGNGGNGGAAGRAGNAIILDVNLNRNSEKYGNNGQPGRGGAGGPGGLGGLSGDTKQAKIDDAKSGSGKYCSVNGRNTYSNSTRAASGARGTSGSDGSINPQTPFSVNDIKTHIVTFISEANRLISNQFFHNFMTAFLNKLNTSTVIPR